MFNAQGGGIKVPCKRCQKQVDSTQFKLDPVYKMMVCPSCIKERLNPPKPVEKKPEEKKPADWDEDDEYLAKAKPVQKPTAQKIDETYVKYKCAGCGYQFKFNTVKRSPGNCPYCSQSVGEFKVI